MFVPSISSIPFQEPNELAKRLQREESKERGGILILHITSLSIQHPQRTPQMKKGELILNWLSCTKAWGPRRSFSQQHLTYLVDVLFVGALLWAQKPMGILHPNPPAAAHQARHINVREQLDHYYLYKGKLL